MGVGRNSNLPNSGLKAVLEGSDSVRYWNFLLKSLLDTSESELSRS